MRHATILVCQILGNRFQPVLFENMAQIESGFDSLEIYLCYHYILYLATNKNCIRFTLLLKQKWVPMQLDLLWIFLLMIYWMEYNWCYQFVIQITLNKLNYVWMMMKLFFFLFLQIKTFCSIFLLNVLRNNIVILRICGVGHTQTYQDDMHYFIFQLEIFKYHYHCHYYYQTRI